MRHAKFLLVFLIVSLVSISIFFTPFVHATDTTDYVDNNTSDVDSHADHGTESNFANEQSTPDSSFDTLTEAATSTPSTSDVFTSGFETGAWDSQFDDVAKTWLRGTSSTPGAPWAPHAGTNMSYCSSSTDGSIDTDNIDMTGATSIGVSFWYMDDDMDASDNFYVYYYDGSAYDYIADLHTDTEDTWLRWTGVTTDSQYAVSNFRLRITATSPDSGEATFLDDVTINKTAGAYNYELDLERQWTTADYDETTEELCIYAGTQDAEALKVDVWDGDSWENVIADLVASQWNNVSVTTYLTGTTFTFRFLGGTESSDTTQSTWEIDSVLLHTLSSTAHIVDASWATGETYTQLKTWNAINDMTTSTGESYTVFNQWLAHIDLTTQTSESYTLQTQTSYNLAMPLVETFSWLTSLVHTSGTNYIIDFLWNTPNSWSLLSATMFQLSKAWSHSPSWVFLSTTNFNIVTSFTQGFNWLVDLVVSHYEGIAYLVELAWNTPESWSLLSKTTYAITLPLQQSFGWLIGELTANFQLSNQWQSILSWLIPTRTTYNLETTLGFGQSWEITLTQGITHIIELIWQSGFNWTLNTAQFVLPPLTIDDAVGIAIVAFAVAATALSLSLAKKSKQEEQD